MVCYVGFFLYWFFTWMLGIGWGEGDLVGRVIRLSSFRGLCVEELV